MGQIVKVRKKISTEIHGLEKKYGLKSVGWKNNMD